MIEPASVMLAHAGSMTFNVIECWFSNKMLLSVGLITLNVIKCDEMLVV